MGRGWGWQVLALKTTSDERHARSSQRGRGTIWCASGRALDVGKHHLEHCWERQESGRVALVCGRIQFHFLSFLFFLVCVGDQVEDHLQGSGHLYVWALDCLSLASTPRCSFAR